MCEQDKKTDAAKAEEQKKQEKKENYVPDYNIEYTEEELADILLYLIRFASLAKIDLQQAALRKMEKNALKYPVEKAKGSDRKYNE